LGTTALVVEGGNEEKELGPDTAVYWLPCTGDPSVLAGPNPGGWPYQQSIIRQWNPCVLYKQSTI